jgi:hypothetical protein
MRSSTRISLLLLVVITSTLLLSAKPINGQVTGSFQINVESPTHASVGSDGTARFVIRIVSINGFAGPVQLGVIPPAQVQTPPLQTYFSFDPATLQLTPNSEKYSVLTMTTTYQYSVSLSISTLSFQVTATGGGVTKSVPLMADIFNGPLSSVQLTDVAIVLEPGTISLPAYTNSPVNQTIRLTFTSGATSNIGVLLLTGRLQAYDQDLPSGLYVSFSPDVVNVVAGQTSTTSVNVLMTPEFLQNGGTYKFAVGINGVAVGAPLLTAYTASTPSTTPTNNPFFVIKSNVLTIIIPPSFNVAVTPSIFNVLIGAGDQQLGVVVTPQNKGLTDPIVLTVQGVPTGILVSWKSNPLIPNGNQPLSTALVLNAPSGTWPATATLHILASSAGITSQAEASLTIQPQGDYSVQSDQQTVYFSGPGVSRSVTLTVVPQGDFRSTITFSVANLPSDVTATFSIANVTIQQSTAVTVLLTLTAGPGVQPGTYDLSIVTNTGFSPPKTLILTLLVRAGGYEIWPIVLVAVLIIALISIVAFLPRGREVRTAERETETERARLPP